MPSVHHHFLNFLNFRGAKTVQKRVFGFIMKKQVSKKVYQVLYLHNCVNLDFGYTLPELSIFS